MGSHDKSRALKYVGTTGLGETSEERIKNLKKAKPKKIVLDVDNAYLERSFDTLPFFYIDPDNTRIFWMCNMDENDRITSVYQNCLNDERLVGYFDTIEEAIQNRNELIRMGWVEGQLPKVNVEQENWNALSRQRKKQIIRKLHKQAIKEEKDQAVRNRLKRQLKHPGKLLGPTKE